MDTPEIPRGLFVAKGLYGAVTGSEGTTRLYDTTVRHDCTGWSKSATRMCEQHLCFQVPSACVCSTAKGINHEKQKLVGVSVTNYIEQNRENLQARNGYHDCARSATAALLRLAQTQNWVRVYPIQARRDPARYFPERSHGIAARQRLRSMVTI